MDSMVRVHTDFYKKLEEIRKMYEDKHGIKVSQPVITKMIAEQMEVNGFDIFCKDDSNRKKKKLLAEGKHWGFTNMYR